MTFSLGEQLVGISTPEGMAPTPEQERVLRLYTATHNHQTVMTLEYAVGNVGGVSPLGRFQHKAVFVSPESPSHARGHQEHAVEQADPTSS